MSSEVKNGGSPRNALVTGSSQGLGRALAEECARRGMNVFLVALPGSGLSQVAQGIAEKWNVKAAWLEADLTEENACDRLLAALDRDAFPVDLLVNNAGIGSIGTFAESPLAGHESVMCLNMLALTRLTHRMIPQLARRANAHILNVASLGAFFPMVSLPVYSATKSFVLTFSLALHEELRGSVGVGTLCPNTIRNDRATEEYVDRLPLVCRRACLYPSEIARSGIDGLLRGKSIIVPGLINKMLRVIGPLVPRSLVTLAVRSLWGGFKDEAKHAVGAES
jgi:uncharacterized protein